MAEIIAGIAVELVMAAIAFSVLLVLWMRIFGWPRRVNVLPFQHGVVLEDGRAVKAVGPGGYWVGRRRNVVACDSRAKPFQIQTVDCISADRMAVRISLSGEYRVSDPMKFVVESSDSFGKFYLEVRQALNTAVSELDSSQFLIGHPQITERVRELLVPHSVQLGIELTQLNLLEAIPFGCLRPL